MKNRAGDFTVNLSGEMQYKSFNPAPLPPVPPIEIDSEMQRLLTDAAEKTAALQAVSSRIPNIELFVSMYVRKEALLSSQIEGTQCTLDDILDPSVCENANADVSDVINYVSAYRFALDRMKTLPLCCRLLKEIHSVMLSGVRGGEKTPGEFRTSQNQIGGYGSTIKNAGYVPPNPEDMQNALSALEKYLNEDSDLHPLIRAALIHYQFETIHPFLDGNGRVGRLLVVLFLIEQSVISSPVLYISGFLKQNRVEYYDRLTFVRSSGDYEQWVKFFLRVTAMAAEDAVETADRLCELREQSKAKINGYKSSVAEKLLKLLSYIEKSPIIETKRTAEALELSYNTAAKYIEILCKENILKQSSVSGKTKQYSYFEYIEILKKDT